MEHLREKAELLRIKECDLRLDTLMQCDTSIDRGIHIGGAFSALTSMTALYYGGVMDYNVENPTDISQDIFLLSKGHAVAALASVYGDVGYIDREALENSRGYGALIKGHPGPVIPGVPVATGPLGHGISIACGYALARRERQRGNVFCMVGDGELQEGSCWEGILLGADRNLSNLCIIVDKNNGQSDNTGKLVVSMDQAARRFRGFGYRVLEAYGEEMESILEALETFIRKPQGGRPTAIICHGYKGFGGRGGAMGSHKAVLSPEETALEMKNQRRLRRTYIENLNRWDRELLAELAKPMGLCLVQNKEGRITDCTRFVPHPGPRKASAREKELVYPQEKLKPLDRNRKYDTFTVAKETMATLARDPRLYSVDADLANASGLFDGVSRVDRGRALNVGIAECNMLCVAEALASEGANVWVSTFPPFFDQRALRRIAVSYQERQEAIEEGWLNEGHNLDITFLATSANLETGVNGATHMGNDDWNLVRQMAGVKVIDVSCPQLLQAVMKWIAQGNRGLVYVRTMKTPLPPLYPPDFVFSYGKACYLRKPQKTDIVLVSSGHGVWEAMEAAKRLEKRGIKAAVLDMPSKDEEAFGELAAAEFPVVFAEQNNGALAEQFGEYLVRQRISCKMEHIYTVNTRNSRGELQYIQSGTYPQLIQAFHLAAENLEETVRGIIK